MTGVTPGRRNADTPEGIIQGDERTSMTSSDSTPSFLDRLKRLVGGGGDDGRLPGSVDATRGRKSVV